MQAEQFERLIDKLLEAPQQSFYVFDYRSQRMIIGERQTAALYGYTPDDIHRLPEGWLSVIHPDDRARVASNNKRLKENRHSGITAVQMRVVRKDGGIEWIAHTHRALERDARGRMILEVGMVQVITNLVKAAESQHESEALYRTIFERAADGILLVSPEGVILEANPQFCHDTDYARDDLIGMDCRELVMPGRQHRVEENLRKLSQKRTLTGSGFHMRSDGTVFPHEYRLRRLDDGRILMLTRNITERIQFEEAARQHTSMIHGLFDNNTSGVARFDDKFRLVDVNPALSEMTGIAEEKLIGSPAASLAVSEDRQRLSTLLRAMRTGAGYEKSLPFRLRGKDGRTIHVHAAPTALHRRGRRDFLQGILILTDITGRIEAEEALRKKSSFNQALLASTGAFIAVLDSKGRVVEVNPAAERMMAVPAKDLIGKTPWQLGIMKPDEIISSRQRFRRLLQGEESIASKLSLKSRDGQVRTIELISTAILKPGAQGEVDNIICIGADVTEREQLQRVVLQISEKEQERIGHDLHDGIGQALCGIGSMMESLEAGLAGPQRKQAARILEVLQTAVKDVRRLSHGLSPSAVKNRGLAGALKLLAETVRENFRTACDCEIDDTVAVGDAEAETHLYRIAQEAVSNAMRHGKPSKVRIRLKRTAPGAALLAVGDNGRGFNVKATRRKEGIGLRVMEYRAGLVGGGLSISSTLKHGTEVRCRFASLRE